MFNAGKQLVKEFPSALDQKTGDSLLQLSALYGPLNIFGAKKAKGDILNFMRGIMGK